MTNIIDTAMALDASTKRSLSLLQHEHPVDIKLRKIFKRRRLAAIDPPRRIVTEQRWAHFFEGCEDVAYIPADYFATPFASEDSRLMELSESLLIISNTPPQNANVQSLVNFYNACQLLNQTLIVIWDWDNHHHLHISTILSASADIYLPSHKAHDFELTSFCDYVWRVPLSSIQWSDRFLIQHADRIAHARRGDGFGGNFVEYGLFPLRNNRLRHLSKFLPDVKLVDGLSNYWAMSPVDRLDDWTRYKGQWIEPTLNDLSTRVFDALITGNVVAIPRRFQFDEALSDLHPDDFVCYDQDDLNNPLRIQDIMVKKFDNWGGLGINRRIHFGIKNNLDKRIRSIAHDVIERYIKN